MDSRTAPAADSSPASVGTELGDLTRQIDRLRDDASTLMSMYESDDEVYSLASQARLVRDRADRIGSTLTLMGDALQNLEI